MAAYQNEREQLAQLEWLFQQEKFAEGLARTESALREFPTSFHLKFLRYRFLRQLRKPAEAMQLLREMHALSGDNILVVRELADLHFQQQQYGESLLYYKKLVFLEPFNAQAQERLKSLQGLVASGVSDLLADTKAEFQPEVAAPAAPPAPEAAAAVTPPPAVDAQPAARADGLHFQTESAAELYLQQGMHREALAIYKNLFEKTGSTDHFQKIQAILRRQRAERGQQVIERLQRLLERLQQKGSPIV